MPFKFNPLTSQLDLVNAVATGGSVTSTGSSTDKAIARWDGTSGTIIQNSPYSIVQDGGAIAAQGFVFNRQILNDVTVPGHYTMINTDVELVSGDLYLLGDAALLLL